jgi:hypothetical protein
VTRHGLLLTAVATVTVPGLLAMLAVVGHEHVAAETGVGAAALDGAPLSGPYPVAPATARAMVRDNVAGVQGAAGTPVTVLSRVTVGQQVMGMRLLNGAANAGLAASYQGTELITQSGVAGGVKMISQVWHQGGGLTIVVTSDGTTVSAAARPVAPAVASSDPVSDSPEGVFGVTKSLVAMLSKHYVAVYRGGGPPRDGRPVLRPAVQAAGPPQAGPLHALEHRVGRRRRARHGGVRHGRELRQHGAADHAAARGVRRTARDHLR